MRTIHIFSREVERDGTEIGNAPCGASVRKGDGHEDCIADHAAPNVCQFCVKNHRPSFHKYPALVAS